VMTFLAEWGDRSQISTIALAAAHVGRLHKLIA
jgi:putative Ca2+/H+ antiporter (TMEM165/GDT1 family)